MSDDAVTEVERLTAELQSTQAALRRLMFLLTDRELVTDAEAQFVLDANQPVIEAVRRSAVDSPRQAPPVVQPASTVRNELIWLTTQQVADRVGRPKDAVRRACQVGELHGHQPKPGLSNWRVHRDCVDPWMTGEPCPHGEGGGTREARRWVTAP